MWKDNFGLASLPPFSFLLSTSICLGLLEGRDRRLHHVVYRSLNSLCRLFWQYPLMGKKSDKICCAVNRCDSLGIKYGLVAASCCTQPNGAQSGARVGQKLMTDRPWLCQGMCVQEWKAEVEKKKSERMITFGLNTAVSDFMAHQEGVVWR